MANAHIHTNEVSHMGGPVIVNEGSGRDSGPMILGIIAVVVILIALWWFLVAGGGNNSGNNNNGGGDNNPLPTVNLPTAAPQGS